LGWGELRQAVVYQHPTEVGAQFRRTSLSERAKARLGRPVSACAGWAVQWCRERKCGLRHSGKRFAQSGGGTKMVHIVGCPYPTRWEILPAWA
jgi:hypothetical protein